MLITLLTIFSFSIFAYLLLYFRKDGHSFSYIDCRFDRLGYKFTFFNFIALILLDKGVLALLFHRLSLKISSRILGKCITRLVEFLTGIEIYHNAIIGKHVEIWHGNGVIIGQSAKIGSKCIILQQVTIGAGFVEIGNNVKIGAGAKVLGNISIGEHCAIAANSVVTNDIDGYCLIGGIPAKVIKKISSVDDVVFGTKEEDKG